MKKIILIMFLIAILIFAGCKKEVANENDQAREVVKEISVRAFRFDFDPHTITVNKGDKVRLLLNSDDVKHGFYLEEFNINVPITPGRQTVAEFIADKEGTFNFRCSVPCGEGHGRMTGVLIVK